MAKVSFSKLKIKTVEDVKTFDWEGNTIEVRQYLPIQEKLALIGRVIEAAHEQDYNYCNPVKKDVFLRLEMVFAYTNVSFTDKQKEDLPKLYDLLYSSGFFAEVWEKMDDDEFWLLNQEVNDTIDSLYKYQNSVLGLLDTVSTDYDNLNLDLDKLKEKISDPEQLKLVKGILDKLG